MVERRRNWTEEEITLALSLYMQKVPFTKINEKNPYIIKLAQALHRAPGGVGLKLANLSNCDPKIRQSGRKGMEHGSRLDKIVWDKFVSSNNLSALYEITGQLLKQYNLPPVEQWNVTENTNNDVNIIELPVYETERMATVKLRNGQQFFRNCVLNNFENKCAVTGISQNNLIEAAHIIPWSKCDNELRLSAKNGICLNVLLHRAFDSNLIGIDQDFKVHVNRKLIIDGSEESKNFFNNIDSKDLSDPHIIKVDQDLLKERFGEYLQLQS